MARCCGGGSGTCTCRIHAGAGISVTGSGTSGDPYLVTNLGTVGNNGGGNTFTVAQTVDHVIPPRPAGGASIFVIWLCWNDPGVNVLTNDTWVAIPAP